jgi:hypothetical protein
MEGSTQSRKQYCPPPPWLAPQIQAMPACRRGSQRRKHCQWKPLYFCCILKPTSAIQQCFKSGFFFDLYSLVVCLFLNNCCSQFS